MHQGTVRRRKSEKKKKVSGLDSSTANTCFVAGEVVTNAMYQNCAGNSRSPNCITPSRIDCQRRRGNADVNYPRPDSSEDMNNQTLDSPPSPVHPPTHTSECRTLPKYPKFELSPKCHPELKTQPTNNLGELS
jgi:hypothetical protein